MSAFNRQLATAVRLIAKYGASCTWTKRIETAHDNSKPWKQDQDNATPYTVKMVMLRNKGNSAAPAWAQALIHLMQGTDIPAGKPAALLAAKNLTFVPDQTDLVMLNGATMKVESIDPIAPDGLPIIYIIKFA
jgi:hypothetical protein